MSFIKLFGNPLSGHTYKVRLFLALTDTAYEYEHVDLMQPRSERPAFFRQNARYDEVPLLMMDDVPFVQSNAILLHLSEKLEALQGGDQQQWVVEWLMWEQSRLGHSLPNLRFAKRFQKDTDPAVLEWLEGHMIDDLNVLDTHLDGTEFIVGKTPTSADCSLAGYLYWLDETGLKIKDWPFIQRWLERVSHLDGFKHPDQL